MPFCGLAQGTLGSGCHKNSDLRSLGIKKRNRRFKLISILITWNVLWFHNIHMQQPERSEIFLAATSSGFQTDFNLNIIATLPFYFFIKKSPGNVIKLLAAILNLVSFSLFDRWDCAKPKKISISLFLGMAVAYEHCMTIRLRQTKWHAGSWTLFQVHKQLFSVCNSWSYQKWRL